MVLIFTSMVRYKTLIVRIGVAMVNGVVYLSGVLNQ